MAEKYDRIGTGYNQTRKADQYLVQRLIYHLNPRPGGEYLDIGCGTGNYTEALFRQGIKVIGVDPSQKMLNTARTRFPEIRWLTGKAEAIPLASGTLDGAIATLTIHHWEDLKKAFSELSRVLKPGSRVIIFTSTPTQMKGYWLNYYFPLMLEKSAKQMPSPEQIRLSLAGSGLETTGTEKYFVRHDLEDKFLYSGKHDPSLYLKPEIRQGISSFSSLANSSEVEKGLKKLNQDIKSGRINQIIRRFENQEGDYLFFVSSNRPLFSRENLFIRGTNQ